MPKGAGKPLCPRVASFSGIALLVLGFYVLFMCWDSHQRSAFVAVDLVSSNARMLHATAAAKGAMGAQECKSVSVKSFGKKQGKVPMFALAGQPLGKLVGNQGVCVVMLDARQQVVLETKVYDTAGKYESANAALANDLSQLSTGAVVLVAVPGLGELDAKSISTLQSFGASIVEGDPEQSYALIGVKGGLALAEGKGAVAQAASVLPCNGRIPDAYAKASGKEKQVAEKVDSKESANLAKKDDAGESRDQSAQKPPPKATEVKSEAMLPSSPETTYKCVGGDGNRSCLFRNLYYHRGRFVMFVLKEPKKRIDVYRADKYEGLWRPDVEKFEDLKAIDERVASKAVIEERGLSVQFNPLYPHNIGHAIFDGLYPAFVATVKLNVHDRPWRPVVAVDAGCFEEQATGDLKAGDLIEAYLPHAKYGRTLRAVRARVVSSQKTKAKDPECKWEKGMDYNGLDLGAENVGQHGSKSAQQKTACVKACAVTFGCKAAVIFADICYLKGNEGHAYPKEDRLLCKMVGNASSANVVVKPEPGFDGEMKEFTIPDAWITGKVRRRCMCEGIYQQFGGAGEMRRLFELERDCRNYPNLLIRFEEVVIGVGGAGNMVADPSGAIGGSLAPYNAMSQFRDRMLRAYGLPVDHGVKPLSPDRDLKVIIVSNKRFEKHDRAALDAIVEKLNARGGVHIEFVDWGRIGKPGNKFKEHLKVTQAADVYVSSIGTALQYVPFLKDGKVYIALGAVWMRGGQYFPTFMEQQLAGGGTPYLRTLYADPGGVLRHKLPHTTLGEDGFFAGVNGTIVSQRLSEAESLVRKGFEIPVAPEENLSVEGKILVEICRRDRKVCENLSANRNGKVYECALLLWNEAVVYEVGPWRKGDKCGSVHHKLLRQLRQEHGLYGYGAPDK